MQYAGPRALLLPSTYRHCSAENCDLEESTSSLTLRDKGLVFTYREATDEAVAAARQEAQETMKILGILLALPASDNCSSTCLVHGC